MGRMGEFMEKQSMRNPIYDFYDFIEKSSGDEIIDLAVKIENVKLLKDLVESSKPYDHSKMTDAIIRIAPVSSYPDFILTEDAEKLLLKVLEYASINNGIITKIINLGNARVNAIILKIAIKEKLVSVLKELFPKVSDSDKRIILNTIININYAEEFIQNYISEYGITTDLLNAVLNSNSEYAKLFAFRYESELSEDEFAKLEDKVIGNENVNSIYELAIRTKKSNKDKFAKALIDIGNMKKAVELLINVNIGDVDYETIYLVFNKLIEMKDAANVLKLMFSINISRKAFNEGVDLIIEDADGEKLYLLARYILQQEEEEIDYSIIDRLVDTLVNETDGNYITDFIHTKNMSKKNIETLVGALYNKENFTRFMSVYQSAIWERYNLAEKFDIQKLLLTLDIDTLSNYVALLDDKETYYKLVCEKAKDEVIYKVAAENYGRYLNEFLNELIRRGSAKYIRAFADFHGANISKIEDALLELKAYNELNLLMVEHPEVNKEKIKSALIASKEINALHCVFGIRDIDTVEISDAILALETADNKRKIDELIISFLNSKPKKVSIDFVNYILESCNELKLANLINKVDELNIKYILDYLYEKNEKNKLEYVCLHTAFSKYNNEIIDYLINRKDYILITTILNRVAIDKFSNETYEKICNMAIESNDAGVIYNVVYRLIFYKEMPIDRLIDALIATGRVDFTILAVEKITLFYDLGLFLSKKVEEFVLTHGSAGDIQQIASVKGIDLEKCADAILATEDAEAIFSFFDKYRGVNYIKYAPKIKRYLSGCRMGRIEPVVERIYGELNAYKLASIDAVMHKDVDLFEEVYKGTPADNSNPILTACDIDYEYILDILRWNLDEDVRKDFFSPVTSQRLCDSMDGAILKLGTIDSIRHFRKSGNLDKFVDNLHTGYIHDSFIDPIIEKYYLEENQEFLDSPKVREKNNQH